MPDLAAIPALTPDDRRRAVAAILAKGLVRWHRRARAVGLLATPTGCPPPDKGLEVWGDSRLSVARRTSGEPERCGSETSP